MPEMIRSIPERIMITRMTESSHSRPSEPVSPAEATPARAVNWAEALSTLLASRIAIFQAEAKQASGDIVRRVLCFAIAGLCALFAWILLVAAATAALVAIFGWPWHWMALGAGGLHLLIAAIFFFQAKSPKQDNFSITRSEFLKDREWLQNLQKQKSSD